jgi:FAD/FMN-containing dehydrogenase
MNSGGAHCLKYGVTTNNVLGLKMVLMDGEIVEIGGSHLDSPGYDLLGLVIGSEGQFGIVTEATVRILRSAEGARPMLIGFDSSEAAGQCVSAIIGSGIIPVAIEFMDKPAIHVCEAFAKAGYPMEAEALLIIEVEGSARRSPACSTSSPSSPSPTSRATCASARAPSRAPPSGRAASRPSAPSAASRTTTAWTAPSRSASWPTCWSPYRTSATSTA